MDGGQGSPGRTGQRGQGRSVTPPQDGLQALTLDPFHYGIALAGNGVDRDEVQETWRRHPPLPNQAVEGDLFLRLSRVALVKAQKDVTGKPRKDDFQVSVGEAGAGGLERYDLRPGNRCTDQTAYHRRVQV
jgi:hypothetical protein